MKKKIDIFTPFDDNEEKPDIEILPEHHKTKGGGNTAQFLKQQYLSGYTGAKFNPIPKPTK